MLVLGRKVGQNLVIGGSVVVTILEVDGDRVKVGIDAPRAISVLRGELFAATRDENRLAGTAGSTDVDLLTSLFQPEPRD